MGLIRKILTTRTIRDEYFFLQLKKMLGFTPKNLLFYKKAFIHRSIKEVD